MNWREGIMRMLRLRDFSAKPENEAAERDKIARAKKRLRYLDGQLEIIERRAGKHEPR